MVHFSRFIAASAVVAAASALPQFGSENPSMELVRRAQNVNYNQNYVASGANVQYSPNQSAGSFSVKYNTNQDFVVGLGWQPGDSNPVTFSGSFTASGVGIVSIYGWSKNPLVEYYIMENPIGYPLQGQQKGSFTSDGATYTIWLHQQVNQPSIIGTTTFNQYISIRQSPRNSGTVTIANHFAAWANVGLKLGTLDYQVLAVESWSGSGQGQFSVAKGTGNTGGSSPTTTPVTTTTTRASNPTTTTSSGNGGGGGSSGGSAQWGQCGGIGWTGPTTCQSPYTCHSSNSYYSQCY